MSCLPPPIINQYRLYHHLHVVVDGVGLVVNGSDEDTAGSLPTVTVKNARECTILYTKSI